MGPNGLLFDFALSTLLTSQTCTPNPNTDDPIMAKIVDRHKDEWNTHLFLESVCKEFDPNTGYANMVRRDMVRMHSFLVKPTPSHQPTLAAFGLGMGECTIRRLFCKLRDNTIHCGIYFFFPRVPSQRCS